MARPLTTSSARTAHATIPQDPAAARAPLALAQGADFAPSPARRLQQDLQFAYERRTESRWSPRRTLGFIVLTNGAFWLGLAWTIRAAVS